ncbi:hypothetical protein KVR01_011609 [Diaporthe batatas]|uniref:uncharacterized protein n=1 Tax=Diaporthe batatas TaxID=748121 RepID=UPI001D052CDA|nr:uncharacterized protein KVR01_011609 [Diaporthe batatas]KAG8158487.1 hypothetical protein KVR01_011609 [Diaporthe batatas]
MRFTNVLVALGSVASVVSAFQGVSDSSNLEIADDNAYYDAATTLIPVRLDARADKKGGKKGPKKGDTTSSSKAKAAVATTTTTSQAKVAVATTATTSTAKAAVATTATTTSDAATASACAIKRSRRLRFMPRAFNELEKSPKQPESDGSYNLLENQWVPASALKSGDKVAVTDITGCSAVFLWNKDNLPSVFHIFCEAGAKEAPIMAQRVGDLGLKNTPVAVTIAARDKGEADIIKKAVEAEFGPDCDPDGKGLTDDDFEITVYDNSTPQGRLPTEAFRFDAVAGTRKVTQSKEPKKSKQSRSFASYF